MLFIFISLGYCMGTFSHKKEESIFCQPVQHPFGKLHERNVMHWPALAITLGSLLPALIVRP